MDKRKITVIESKTQKRTSFESSATTLAELKTDLCANGIDPSGMAFYEGTSKTEISQDSDALPRDIEYKGAITNDLTFLLTNADKRIRSGSRSRKEIYDDIKNQNLEDLVKKTYGRNYTNCKLSLLEQLITFANSEISKSKERESPIKEDTENLDRDQIIKVLGKLILIVAAGFDIDLSKLLEELNVEIIEEDFKDAPEEVVHEIFKIMAS